jgi:D-glycero-D-manno-heptose 1,7-bisphosphate phosphatase
MNSQILPQKGRRRGLLLDRDGVVNVDRGYVGSRDAFVFRDGIVPFLRAASDLGYRLAIVTNQSGVARGLYSAEVYEDLTRWYVGELKKQGVEIALVLACFEHPDGSVPAFRRESFWRKPSPGLILEAGMRLNLDLARSVMVGDQRRDMEAALAGGVGRCLWLADQKPEKKDDLGPSVQIVSDFTEARRFVRSFAAAQDSAS